MTPSSGRPPATPVPNEILFIVVLATMSGIMPLSIDMYLPALPVIAADLKGGTAGAQMTLSAYMIGFAGGMLIWGPIGDRYGRRLPMAIGLVAYIAASLACAFARRIDALVALRVLQAAGGCAIASLGQAAVADVFDRDRSARAFSIINTVFLGAPLIAPTLGGLLLTTFSWRAIFVALAGFGLLSILGLLALPETLPTARRRPFSAAGLVRSYREILTHRRYLAYVSTNGLIYGGMFAYLAASPFVFIESFGVSPRAYGLIFGANVFAMMAMSAINSRFVVRVGADRMLRFGVCVSAAAGTVLLVTAMTGFGGLLGVAAPTFVFIGVLGLVGSNAGSGALSEFRHQAGAAAALMGGLSMGLGAVAAAVVGALADGTARPMAVTICGGALAALAINLLAPKRRSAP